jgi:hypothetical protein
VASELALTAENLPQIWLQTLAQTPPMMRSELEKAGVPAIFGPNTLVLRFGSEYNSQREYCQDPRRVEKLEGVVRSLTGQTVTLRIESGGGGPEAANRPAAAAEETDNSQSRHRRQRDEAQRAQIVRVDEGFGAAPGPSAERAEETDREET